MSCRRKFLGALVRRGATEAEQVRREYHEAQARSEREDEETAATMAAKKASIGEEEAELWRDARCRVLGNWARRHVPFYTPTVSRTGRTVAALY